MFKETAILESEQNNEQMKENANILGKKSYSLKFKEILCPMTNKPLLTSSCKQCLHKRILYRKHPLGLTLETIICLFKDG